MYNKTKRNKQKKTNKIFIDFNKIIKYLKKKKKKIFFFFFFFLF